MNHLTASETRLLKALVDAFSGPPDAGENYRAWKTHCRAMGNWHRPSDLQRFGFLDPDLPDSGLHRTAASLIRKGLVARRKMQGAVHYQFTDAGKAVFTPGRVPPDAPLDRTQRRMARLPERRRVVVGTAPTPDVWTCVGSTKLAQRIQGVCALSQTAAEQLAAEVIESGSLEFVTETRVAGRARLGVKATTWRAYRDTDPGQRTDWFKLERQEG